MDPVRYEWDERKRIANLEKHGVDFIAAGRFDWDRAADFGGDRLHYGEKRRVAYAIVDGRLHAMVYTPRGDVRRIISFRRANYREQAAYAAGTLPSR